MFGWEMIKVHKNEVGEKIATFKNVDSGEILEKPFFSACINPPSKTWSELTDAGLVNDQGLVDVNPYTLQHMKYENVFAFGDCIAGNTTRTQNAAHAQNPVVKHNLKNFLAGKELNGIYDGYSYFPMYMSHSHATCFSHTWDYEPAPNNHWVPQYGMIAQRYFNW
jgi:sulfide:quinone oxidoreductase